MADGGSRRLVLPAGPVSWAGCEREESCPLLLARPPHRGRPGAALEAEEAALRESLLADGARDEEAGARKRPGARHHSWVQLLGIAAKYMWPDSWWLQVRRLGRLGRRQGKVGAGRGVRNPWLAARCRQQSTRGCMHSIFLQRKGLGMPG